MYNVGYERDRQLLHGMRSRPGLRTRDLEFLLDDDARVPSILLIVRAGRVRDGRVHRYGVHSLAMAVDLLQLRQRALRFLQGHVAQVLPEFAQLLEPARRAFGRVEGSAGFVGDGVVGVGGVVLFPGLEELRDDDREGAADDGADFFGDGEDEEDCYAVWRVVPISLSSS